MSSGRLPGDFWYRAPGFLPPGAQEEEEELSSLSLSRISREWEEVTDRMLEDGLSDEEPGHATDVVMKRPSAKSKAKAKAKAKPLVMKRPSARSAKAKKSSEEDVDEALSEEAVVETPTKPKATPNARATKTKATGATEASKPSKATTATKATDASKPSKATRPRRSGSVRLPSPHHIGRLISLDAASAGGRDVESAGNYLRRPQVAMPRGTPMPR